MPYRRATNAAATELVSSSVLQRSLTYGLDTVYKYVQMRFQLVSMWFIYITVNPKYFLLSQGIEIAVKAYIVLD